MADPVFTVVAEGTSTTNITAVAYASQPTSSLMLLIVSADDYRSTSGVGRPELSGWALLPGASGESNLGFYVWQKWSNGDTIVQYRVGSAVPSNHQVVAVTNVDPTTPFGGVTALTNVGTITASHTDHTTSSLTLGAGRFGILMCMGSTGTVTQGPYAWTPGTFTKLGTDQYTTAGGYRPGQTISTRIMDGSTTTGAATATFNTTGDQGIGISIALLATSGGGGTSYDKTQADPVGITDQITAQLTRVRTQTDPVGITDQITTEVTRPRTQADPIGVTDQVAVEMTRPRSVDDAVGITDEITVQLIRQVTIDDGIGITDTSDPQTIEHADLIEDPIGITDEVTVQLISDQSGSLTIDPDSELTLAATSNLPASLTIDPDSDLALTAGDDQPASLTVDPASDLTLAAGDDTPAALAITPASDLLLNAGDDTPTSLTIDPDSELLLDGYAQSSTGLTFTPASDLLLNAGDNQTASLIIDPDSELVLTAGDDQAAALTITPSSDVTLNGSDATPAALAITPDSDLLLDGRVLDPGSLAFTPDSDLLLAGVVNSPASLTVDPDSELLLAGTVATPTDQPASLTVTPDSDLTLNGRLPSAAGGLMDTVLLPLLDDLRICLDQQTVETMGGQVCEAMIVSGEQAKWDYCTCGGAKSQCGMAWVRLDNLYPSTVSFPAQDSRPACYPMTAAVIEIGVARCTPVPDRKGTPPSPVAQAQAALVAADDAMAMTRAIGCCTTVTDRPYVVGRYTPRSSGGCGGGRILVTVQLTRAI